MPSISLARILIAGLVTVVGVAMVSNSVTSPNVDMYIEPATGVAVIGETFTIQIVVRSDIPVNVFKGSLTFSPDILTIQSIDYNTSIADLWAELPWYSNGDGTMNFTGGTTQPGGFSGEDTLIEITFLTKAIGQATIGMDEIRILQHDGLGSDAQLNAPIDAVFQVEEKVLAEETVLEKSATGPQIQVLANQPDTDLNDDGREGILDISIFMSDLATQNLRSDLNQDGVVNLADFSILNN